jgi:tetratricopeptide (TPR) repeat protein
LDLSPVYVDAYVNRGTAFFLKKEYVRAIADYTEALRLQPSLARVHEARGRAYREIGDIEKAICDEQRAREFSH